MGRRDRERHRLTMGSGCERRRDSHPLSSGRQRPDAIRGPFGPRHLPCCRRPSNGMQLVELHSRADSRRDTSVGEQHTQRGDSVRPHRVAGGRVRCSAHRFLGNGERRRQYRPVHRGQDHQPPSLWSLMDRLPCSWGDDGRSVWLVVGSTIGGSPGRPPIVTRNPDGVPLLSPTAEGSPLVWDQADRAVIHGPAGTQVCASSAGRTMDSLGVVLRLTVQATTSDHHQPTAEREEHQRQPDTGTDQVRTGKRQSSRCRWSDRLHGCR